MKPTPIAEGQLLAEKWFYENDVEARALGEDSVLCSLGFIQRMMTLQDGKYPRQTDFIEEIIDRWSRSGLDQP